VQCERFWSSRSWRCLSPVVWLSQHSPPSQPKPATPITSADMRKLLIVALMAFGLVGTGVFVYSTMTAEPARACGNNGNC
jgi:hypothetical protein